MMSRSVCAGCGARLAEGAVRCDLCGTPASPAKARADEPSTLELPEQAPPGGGIFCNECGWKNPGGANFCSRCGTALRGAGTGEASAPWEGGTRPVGAGEVAAAAAAGGTPEDSAPISRHVALVVGLSVLVVIALYMVTVISKQRSEPADAASAVQAPADVRSAAVIDEYEAIPIGARYTGTVDSLRAVISDREGESARPVRRELVDFLTEIGRIDRAAIEQERLARETNQVDDWRRAGNLLYDWMESVRAERKTDVALLAIEAYENVLEQDPDDLDARADLGWVYQYDQQNPMKAIQQTTAVLEADPDHLAANYNRGVFLLRINRVEDAAAQFERVIELAGSESPYTRQAEAWLRTIEREGE